MTEMENAGVEAMQEMASAILTAAGVTMQRHGNDPNGRAIIAAGFAMALQMIGKSIDHKIPATVKKML